MARPQKEGAEYFPHDGGLRNDERMLAVRRKFGLEGYAVYVMVLEKAATNEDFIFNVGNDVFNVENSTRLELLAGEFGISTETLADILQYFLKLGMLKIEGQDCIKVPYLMDRMQPLISKREREREYYESKRVSNVGNYKKKGVSNA